MKFPFINLQAQKRRVADQLEAAIARVLNHGQFILGPEIPANYPLPMHAYYGREHQNDVLAAFLLLVRGR